MAEVKTRQEIEYSKELGAVISSEGNSVVYYVEDINPEVIESVIEMWNDGRELSEITDKLAKRFDDICTAEEREYIQTQIENWERVSGATTTVEVKDVLHKDGTVETVTVTTTVFDKVPKEVLDKAAINAGIATHEDHLEPVQELSKGQKAAATRKANSAGKVSTGS